jgi:hypothetical protein
MRIFVIETGWLACKICLSLAVIQTVCCGNSNKIRLEDIRALTLHHGSYTAGRRSSPVPQLKCIGGTAGCSAFVPKVVQCYNRGSDGTDIQWECKTDMDNAYRFGEIAVTCEGYDYPGDPYVLKGSCGLEYRLDLTKEGYEQAQHYGGSHHYYDDNTGIKNNKVSTAYTVACLVFVVIIIYAIYQCLLSSNTNHHDAPPPYASLNTDNAQPPPYAAPPPPGFRPEFMPNYPHTADYTSQNPSCGSYSTHGPTARPNTNNTDGRPGFWSGAAAGSLIGYLFGSRSSGPSTHHQSRNSWGTTHQQPTTSPSSGLPSSSNSNYSTGTRTASGFGGTRHR